MLLLSHGYFIQEDEKEQEIMKPYPPLGILYVSAWLEKHGFEHSVFDTTFSSKDALKAELLAKKPKYLALYVNLMTRINVSEIILFIKQHPELKDCTIILGGPEVKYNAPDFLNVGADFLVVGEGEQSIQELLAALYAGEHDTLESIAGISFLKEDGTLHKGPERLQLKDLSELPWPNRGRIDLNLYLEAWKTKHPQNALSVSTMRGCPYTCKWCSRAVYGLSYRRRPVKDVVDELSFLMDTYTPDTFWFVDDVFTVSHKWLAAFSEEVQSRNLNIKYEIITRADRLNAEALDLLKASGCFRIWIGAESGSQKIIDKMDRRVDVHKVREMIQLTRTKGMEAGTFIMLGYPGETEEDIEETIEHLKQSNPHQFTITVAYPIKGTELFQEVESTQTHAIDFTTQNDRDRDFDRTYNRKYYDYAVRRVVNEVKYAQEKLDPKHGLKTRYGMLARATAARLGMWLERKRGK